MVSNRAAFFVLTFLGIVTSTHKHDLAQDPLRQAGIIPHTLPIFVPETFPILVFERAVAFLGNSIHQNDTKYAPLLSFEADPGFLYTLVIVDNDAPQRNNNIISQVEHFLAFNIQGEALLTNLTILGEQPTSSFGYIAPSPPAGCGIHRYVIGLYRQKKRIDPGTVGLGTSQYPLMFNIKHFAKSLDMQLVGANFWTTSASDASHCTFFTDASESTIAQKYASEYKLITNASHYHRTPN